ncbi:MAG: hypothetical protein FJW29_01785 [Acidobacteria bacterium]|nr:hypothetical protein [Acidobacteriota bacterium]
MGHTAWMMPRRRAVSLGVSGLVMLCLLLPPSASAQGRLDVFEPLTGNVLPASRPARERTDGGPRVERSQAWRVRFDRLADALASSDRGPAASLSLALFDDVAVEADVERTESTSQGFDTWVGHVAGEGSSHVALTWKDDVLTGVVQTGGRLFQLSGTGGIVEVSELDASTFGREAPPVRQNERARDVPAADPAWPDPLAADSGSGAVSLSASDVLQARARAEAAAAVRAAGDVSRDGEPLVDIYVYYTAQARVNAGSTALMQAEVAAAIANSNTAYSRSGMAGRVRLVGMSETPLVQSTSDMLDDLRNFTNSAAVATMRNTTGADLMHLIVANVVQGTCGIAWLGPAVSFAHGVTARTCLAQYTFTHEIGHNFGNEHSLEDFPDGLPTDSFRAYSFGYKRCGGSAPQFRSIMAYVCPTGSTARVLNLSNPQVTTAEFGAVTGTAQQNNARSQQEAFATVASFRQSLTTSVPGAPRNVAASAAGNTLFLSWEPPATGQPVTDYWVQAGTASGASNLFDNTVGQLTAVSGPVGSGTYFLRVFGRNAGGNGTISSEVSARVGGVPGAPSGMAATTVGGRVSLFWNTPTEGGMPTTYVVQVGTAPGASNIFSGPVGVVTSVAGDLTPGTYYARVFAQSVAGAGGLSPEASFTIASCTAAPVLSGGLVNGLISLRWNTPAGASVTGFTIQAGPTSGSSSFYGGPIGLTTQLDAQVGSGTYFIRVLADTACGRGAVSNELRVTVP